MALAGGLGERVVGGPVLPTLPGVAQWMSGLERVPRHCLHVPNWGPGQGGGSAAIQRYAWWSPFSFGTFSMYPEAPPPYFYPLL